MYFSGPSILPHSSVGINHRCTGEVGMVSQRVHLCVKPFQVINNVLWVGYDQVY